MVNIDSNNRNLSFFIKLMSNYSLGIIIYNTEEVNILNDFSEQLGASLSNLVIEDIKHVIADLNDNTVYYYVDKLNIARIIIRIANDPAPTYLVVGPYTTTPYTKDNIMAIIERNHLAADDISIIEQYCHQIPFFSDDSYLIAAVNTFAEDMWGGSGNYSVETIREKDTVSPFIVTVLSSQDNDTVSQILTATMLEKRYAIENQVLSIITQGQIHKLDQFLSSDNAVPPMEARLADPLRNCKNYLIITNTLLRKAAEQGGVHPIYINDVSKEFFLKIESLHSVSDFSSLNKAMMRKYCLLVHNHSMQSYSQLVQRTIILIDSDLNADLSLSSMANMLNVNASYLSSHFHKETGQTLTSYVNNKRIEYAIMLLNTTNLQIQTIAQYCGIADINYFTRIFKKNVGMTPTQYRESIKS